MNENIGCCSFNATVRLAITWSLKETSGIFRVKDGCDSGEWQKSFDHSSELVFFALAHEKNMSEKLRNVDDEVLSKRAVEMHFESAFKIRWHEKPLKFKAK